MSVTRPITPFGDMTRWPACRSREVADLLFLVPMVGWLFAGPTQAQATDDGTSQSVQLWQLGVALALPIVYASGAQGRDRRGRHDGHPGRVTPETVLLP